MKTIIASGLLLLWQAASLQAAVTVTHIAAGSDHSLFIKSDGSLWAMGDNSFGQLGDDTLNSTNRPEQVVSSGVVAIAAGARHSLFVKSDGSLWGMGANGDGELGDGTLSYYSSYTNRPEEIVSNGVVAVAAGNGYTLFVKSDGSLWGMGANGAGQLGNSTTNAVSRPEEIVSNDVVAIAAGAWHSLFVKSDGSLWAMGDNSSGQLGDGTLNSTNRPQQIVASGVVAISAGDDHSLFIKSDGSLWGMGTGSSGQLGNGTNSFVSYSTPLEIVSNEVEKVAAGADHTLFLKSDGSLWATGLNRSGQLGDGTYNNAPAPEEIVSNDVVAIAAGYAHSLFTKSDGSLWAMGYGVDGELGDGFGGTAPSTSTTPFPEQVFPLPPPRLTSPVLSAGNAAAAVTTIAGGGMYSFFIQSNGSLWAMGYNHYGQLGDGTLESACAPELVVSTGVVNVVCGRFASSVSTTTGAHTLFLKSDGSLWAMGRNDWGQLGDGTFNSTNRPEEVVSSGVVAIAAGYAHSLFVKADGSLWGMGMAFNKTNRPEEVVSNGVVAIAAGYGHSLFVKADGSLWGMGTGFSGQLGNGTNSFVSYSTPLEIVSNEVEKVAAGANHTLFLKSDGSLWAMGNNYYGQLGDGTLNSTNRPEEIVSNDVVAIAAGYLHSLFIKSDGSLWAMGYNNAGQLGDGTRTSANRPQQIVAGGVVAISAGDDHSLFIKSDGSLWGMGGNSAGQMGNGSPGSLLPEKLVGGPWLRATCLIGGRYYLLSTTNLALPLSQWAPIWTNDIVLRGANNFSAPLINATNSGADQRFYILQTK